MKKAQILVDLSTGKYYTNDDENYWSDDINHAYRYKMTDDLETIVECLYSINYCAPFENVFYLEVKTVICY